MDLKDYRAPGGPRKAICRVPTRKAALTCGNRI
jgi:hypothetical protein